MRKNLHGLVRALALYRSRSKDDLQLVLTGPHQTDMAMELLRAALDETGLAEACGREMPASHSVTVVL